MEKRVAAAEAVHKVAHLAQSFDVPLEFSSNKGVSIVVQQHQVEIIAMLEIDNLALHGKLAPPFSLSDQIDKLPNVVKCGVPLEYPSVLAGLFLQDQFYIAQRPGLAIAVDQPNPPEAADPFAGLCLPVRESNIVIEIRRIVKVNYHRRRMGEL